MMGDASTALAPDAPVLIVAHGSPADPEPQERALQALAAKVAALLPGRRVLGTTLAKPGAFETQVEALGHPVIYPFFMADGFFIRTVLAKRAAPFGLTILPPFGQDPALTGCIAAALQDELARLGWSAPDTALLVAAHGSAVSDRNAQTTQALADQLAGLLPFRTVRCGFVEQDPALSTAAQNLGQAICLPFFALRAGHYVDDVPNALASAGFAGPILPPFVDWPQSAQLIADVFRR